MRIETYSELPSDIAIKFAEKAIGLPVVITEEDRLRMAIVEACDWLRQGAPSRALEVLEKHIGGGTRS